MNDLCEIEVTDLKQSLCCPRLVYYRYCLPDIRPLTYTMQVGTLAHQQEEEREVRRSLSAYGLERAERLFHVPVYSEVLQLKGKVDLVLFAPSRDAAEKEVIVVEYKYSEQKAGPHFQIQLAAYALLLEEMFQLSVQRSFLYSIPRRKVELVPINSTLRNKVRRVTQEIKQLYNISDEMGRFFVDHLSESASGSRALQYKTVHVWHT